MADAPDRQYAVTVAGVCFLTAIAAAVAVLKDGPAAVAAVSLVSTNITVLLGASKLSKTHKEVKALTNGGLTKAIKDAAANEDLRIITAPAEQGD